MKCTECEEPIRFHEEDVTVQVIYADGHVEAHCHHHPFDEADKSIVAILGSDHCYKSWVQRRSRNGHNGKLSGTEA